LLFKINVINEVLHFEGLAQAVEPSMSKFSAENYATRKSKTE